MDRLWARAGAALEDGDIESAHEIYRLLSRRKPDTANEFLLIGLAAYRLHDIARALEVFEEGQRRYPSVAPLVEHFLRIGVEHGLIDRTLRNIDPEAAKAACERLLTRTTDWDTQVYLVVYCERAGLRKFADAKIDEIVRECEDPAAIWRLSDLLFFLGRQDAALRIYQELSVREADDAVEALYCALSLERLGTPEKAIDRLKSELARYSYAEQLNEHLLRICFQHGQIETMVDVIGHGGREPEAVETLFERLTATSDKLRLIEHLLEKREMSFVKGELCRGVREGGYESSALVSIAQRLEVKGFPAGAREVYEVLVNRPCESPVDACIAATSALHLGNVELCMRVLEEEQKAYPSTVELHSLYLQICANCGNYERYSAFMKGAGGASAYGVYSIDDFYKASIEAQGVTAFVLNYREIQRLCTADVFASLRDHVLASIRKTKLPREQVVLFAFYIGYLDLDDDFVSSLSKLLRDQAKRRDKDMGAPESEQRATEMLLRLTPPMIPAQDGQSEKIVRRFIDACHSLASRPVELTEPIRDMSNGWTPWQYVFCTGAIHEYGSAMSAMERIAFQSWPKLSTIAPHVRDGARRAGSGGRIRIGFIVHDSMPMMSGLLSGLDPSVFETVFLRPGKMGRSRAAQNWIYRAESVVEFSDTDTYAAIDTIAAQKLDIIVSGPSGAAVFFPVMARLAHLQIVLLEPNWTDGLTNADYYISWKPAEPAELGEFYTTKTALLKYPPYYIERHGSHEISDDTKDELRRRLLGAGASDRVYLCANTPPKIHPDMDEMFFRLLESDPEGRLVILRGEYPPAKTLRTRLS